MKRIRKEIDISVAHTKNINRKYDNTMATAPDMEYDHIELQSFIDDLTSGLVISRESANKTKTNWTTTRIIKFHLNNMYKH